MALRKRKGRFINLADAQKEVDTFNEVNAKAFTLIQTALAAQEEHVKKYYSDNVTSFVFEKSLLKALLLITDELEDVDAIRVYHAATGQDEGLVKKGTASIIMVPAKLKFDSTTGEVLGVENLPFSEELFGIQYPGIVANPTPAPAPSIWRDPRNTVFIALQ